MINLLRKRFIKNHDNINDNDVRAGHGKLAAIFGIISNLFLFIVKILVGIFTFNVSVFADSINNLSDMASSIIILVGFHYAKMPADKEHPYGHQRIEYIAGLIVSLVIILSGGIMVYTSIMSIINYEYEEPNMKIAIISLVILGISVLIKLYQSHFNRTIAKIISSEALKATSQDSLNDSIATTLVFIVLLTEIVVYKNNAKLSFSLEGVLGILISLYIILSGFMMIKEEINPLIGHENSYPKSDEVIEKIKNTEGILGVHDVICHSYGPTKVYMTVHAEMDSRTSIMESHDIVDALERKIKNEYNIELTLHVDPIDFSDEELNGIRILLDNVISNYYDSSYHDLRFIHCNTKEKMIELDLSIPYKSKYSVDEVKESITNELKNNNIFYEIYYNIDRK